MTLDPVPVRVKIVRPIGNPKLEEFLVECSHPEDRRGILTVGPRAGLPICLVCKGDDLLRSCLVIAHVPARARRDAEARPEPAPEQASLF